MLELDMDVLTAHDPGWDEARMAWNLSVDQRPAAVVHAEGAADVVAVVERRAGALQKPAGVAVQRHHVGAADVQMNLDRHRIAGLVQARPEEDEQQMLAIGLDLRTLAELAAVLPRERVKAQHAADVLDELVVGVMQVQPEELVARPKVAQQADIRRGEHASHPLHLPARPPFHASEPVREVR